ncbi:hypothetical protein [Paenibacillus sp. A3]|uniref:hypothetical protein n=1 Tax=Paenibacillus sp. A3 TaxID=1337054 RepID=UPI000A679F25|nr:hypothetical protein [Paenibacillus sp. A3]
MKPKIMCLLLVFLLSISITACSNDKSSLNFNNSRNSSSDPTSSSSIPINNPSESKIENIKTQMPSEDNKNYSVLEAYTAVLQNKVNFSSTDNKKKVYLNDFLTNEEIYGTTFKVTRFAIIDLDGDKIPEVVLELTPGKYPEFYEVLHYMEGSVYGYIQVYRGFQDLKSDGTFRYSNGVSNNGYGKLSFESNAYKTDILGYQNTSSDGTTTFFIKNKPVTEEAYNSFTKEEDGKKDVVWHEFSDKNIETELSKIHNGS